MRLFTRAMVPFAVVPFIATLLVSAAYAQYPPGQYPPGQYPPGGYPPGGYPPDQYPNTYPGRLPGGVPIGIQVPPINLPKKQPREKGGKPAEDQKFAAADGTLRQLREKDLLLQTSRQRVLRFRLLTKTQFRNKAGEPIRDSLLHPGDLLSVLVNPDDPETALRIVLTRAGTAAERSAASARVEEASIREPQSEDLGKPRSVAAPEKTTEPETVAETPKVERPAERPPAAADPGSDSRPAAPPERPVSDRPVSDRPMTDGQIIEEARAASATFAASLPNFLAQQVTTRYFSAGLPAQWRQIDVVTAELAYVNGKEDYRNIQIDGQPAYRPVERTGQWSTGEFGTTLEDLMSASTKAAFKKRGEEKTGGRLAWVFDYKVAQENSHWDLVAPDQRQYHPAYEGAIWIDKETRRVLRIEQRATDFPRDFPINRAECTLEYAYVRIDQQNYLMPSSGENIGCMSGAGTCTRNAIAFRDYRKFGAESNIKFDKQFTEARR